MLENIFLKDVKIYIKDPSYRVYFFPGQGKKQKRPIFLVYTFVTRSYANYFHPGETIIDHFNKRGFDVYLIDWGNDYLDSMINLNLSDFMSIMKNVFDSLLDKYEEKINIFAICAGGLLVKFFLCLHGEEYGNRIHRLAFYGTLLMGDRDLGVRNVFRMLYELIKNNKQVFRYTGISIPLLNSFILQAVSASTLKETWSSFYEDSPSTFFNALAWMMDDRLISAELWGTLVYNGFILKDHNPDEIEKFVTAAKNIHFLNIVGESDLIVVPSASIIDHNNYLAHIWKSFTQKILGTGHFLFLKKGYKNEKEEIAEWFAGEEFHSLVFKKDTKKIIISIRRKLKYTDFTQKYLLLNFLKELDGSIKNIETGLKILEQRMRKEDLSSFLIDKISPCLSYISEFN